MSYLVFFLIIDLYCLIPAVIAQIFNPNSELVITIGTPPINEANAEIESNSKPYTPFYAFHSLYHYLLFILKDDFFFHQYF